jgi:hypothetical protein
MQLDITDHIWTISELVQAARSGSAQARVRQAKTEFRVIQGGKT